MQGAKKAMPSMETRHSVHWSQAESMGTEDLRTHFLIEQVMTQDRISCVYLHEDRMMVLGCIPGKTPITFDPAIGETLRATHLLERRELGVFNIGGPGEIHADGTAFQLGHRDALYLGRGTGNISFRSIDPTNPAKFYMNSAPAHAAHPNKLIRASDVTGDTLGTQETANRRVLTKYIHPGNGPSCQLVMGITRLEPGSIWNTMPAHTHDRRMETYLYFDVAPDACVMHFMGRPHETRHMVVRNEQVIVSPPWSIHSGAGTKAYSFVWSMAGENQAFTDMDAVPIGSLA
jgi:4-deoxy-L-threo-5-hexosulose-uronate ketol-isomerase